MKNEYFGKKNNGGPINSIGIAFQDCVSLIHLFENIDKDDFKEITFETIDDFTIIFNSFELCVQVKSNILDFASAKSLVNLLRFEDGKRYLFVCSGYKHNFRIFLTKLKQARKAFNSSRPENEKLNIEQEVKQMSIDKGLDYDKLINVDFRAIPLENVFEFVKLRIYEWEKRNNLEVQVDDLINSLISKILLDLRPLRGFLDQDDVIKLASTYKRKKVISNSKKYCRFVGASLESIIEGLAEDACTLDKFSNELTLTKLYLEKKDFESAMKEMEKIVNYREEVLTKYYLFVLFASDKLDEVKKYCYKILDKRNNDYYANFYLGMFFKQSKLYKEAINFLLIAANAQNTFEVNYHLARLYQEDGQSDKSLEYYSCCLEQDNMNPKVHFHISKLLPYDEAIEHLDKAISLDGELYDAYMYKGKILRYFSRLEEAYKYFKIYMKYKQDMEVIKELALCLLDMGKEESNFFLAIWIESEMGEQLKCIKNGESIVIVDILWHNSKFLICTKDEEDFLIETPLSKFKILTRDSDGISIGIVQDSFLKMSCDFFKKNGKPVPKGFEYIPCFTKRYKSKSSFDKTMNLILSQNILNINKDYSVKDHKDKEIKFKEYITRSEDAKILINDYMNYKIVDVTIGSFRVSGEFKESGEGYFAFESKIEEGTPFNEAVIILICTESKEVVHIKMNLSNIKVVKKPCYEAFYVGDIELPLE